MRSHVRGLPRRHPDLHPAGDRADRHGLLDDDRRALLERADRGAQARRQDSSADGSALRVGASRLRPAERISSRAAGIPMRNRDRRRHPALEDDPVRGQGQVEFAGANYAPFETDAADPCVNFTDEIVYFSNDPPIVHSFMTKFDDLWTSTTEFADYANITGAADAQLSDLSDRPAAQFPARRELPRAGGQRLRRRSSSRST